MATKKNRTPGSITNHTGRGSEPSRALQLREPVGSCLFEVSAEEVGNLDDVQFRELVARLCKAALADAGLPVTWVTWGGDQREPDDGIDVRVTVPEGTALPDNLSCRDPLISELYRKAIGFQVKRTKMPPSAITKEMRPRGTLQDSIQHLVQAEGAYIIAASDSVADGRLRERVAAMKEAVAAVTGHQKALLDYYDSRRLADWVNRYPSVVAWLKEWVSGHALQGWRPYGQWTGGTEAQAFLDDEAKRFIDYREPGRAFTLKEGLQRVRDVLRQGGASVRLAGLSGVGKTRFVQALFEEGVGELHLPAEWAVYTDTAWSPDPAPLMVLHELIVKKARTIVVVDNCPGEVHRQLIEQLGDSDARVGVSILTIEYDIREDFPERTDVFRLKEGSSNLIGSILGQRFPQILSFNRQRIASFSGGNARVALALAQQVSPTQSLAALKDEQLFERLFWQRGEKDHSLMRAAEVCALVYSFDGGVEEGPSEELQRLAALAEMTVPDFHRHVAELKRRELIQQRGIWLAVLPQAIAIRLASCALEAIPLYRVKDELCADEGRLLISFSRRLGYLHGSQKAQGLVRGWLSVDGLLYGLDSFCLVIQVLANVAPVNPELALEFAERLVNAYCGNVAFQLDRKDLSRLATLIRSLAYDQQFFDRSMDCLVQMKLCAESKGVWTKEAATGIVTSLFYVRFSGTNASLHQRVSWVRKLLLDQDERPQSIGLACLSAAFDINGRPDILDFDFGAHQRDQGLLLERGNKREWLSRFIDLAVEIGRGKQPVSVRARSVLADAFRVLWRFGMSDELVRASGCLAERGWWQGWLAVRKTMFVDGEKVSPDHKTLLESLELKLAPSSLVDGVKAIVLTGSSDLSFSDPGLPSSGYMNAKRRAFDLGCEFGRTGEIGDGVLRLLTKRPERVPARQGDFGQGMASSVPSIEKAWDDLVDAFESWPEAEREADVIRGFLIGVIERDVQAFKALIRALMDRSSLIRSVPWLLTSACEDPAIQASGSEGSSDYIHDVADALLKLASRNDVQASDFFCWARYFVIKLPQEKLAVILETLLHKEGGVEVALEILHMFVGKTRDMTDEAVHAVAYRLLSEDSLWRIESGDIDDALAAVIRAFLASEESAVLAVLRQMLINIRNSLVDYSVSGYDFMTSLQAVFEVNPVLALDVLAGEGDVSLSEWGWHGLVWHRWASVLANVPLDTVLNWCCAGSARRWAHAARLLLPVPDDVQSGEAVAWSDRCIELIKAAPDEARAGIGRALTELIPPVEGWCGSEADAIRRRLPLLDQLAALLGPGLEAEVAEWRRELDECIARAERRERERQSERERFE